MGAASDSPTTHPFPTRRSSDLADNATDYLAEGQTATEKFTVTVSDGHGGTVDQLVTITIHGTNEAPTIHLVTTDTAAANFSETNAGLSTNGTLTVTDVDLTDTGR